MKLLLARDIGAENIDTLLKSRRRLKGRGVSFLSPAQLNYII